MSPTVQVVDYAETRQEAWRKASQYAEILRDKGIARFWCVGVKLMVLGRGKCFYVTVEQRNIPLPRPPTDENPPAALATGGFRVG